MVLSAPRLGPALRTPSFDLRSPVEPCFEAFKCHILCSICFLVNLRAYDQVVTGFVVDVTCRKVNTPNDLGSPERHLLVH